MGADDVEGVSKDTHHHHHRDSDIELIGGERIPHSNHSGPLNKRVSRRSSKINFSESTTSAIDLNQDEEDKDYVEITMDIQGDTIALHSVKSVTANNSEDEKLGLLGKTMEKKRSFGSSLVRNASIRIKHVSQELKRLTSFSKQGAAPVKVYDRTKSAASYALKGLKFISKSTITTDGDGGAGWDEVEKQFEILTASTNGLLHRSLFAKCIGIVEHYKVIF